MSVKPAARKISVTSAWASIFTSVKTLMKTPMNSKTTQNDLVDPGNTLSIFCRDKGMGTKQRNKHPNAPLAFFAE